MLHETVFCPRVAKPVTQRLSLVALMDIFTILLFFLLLASGESQKIENARFVDIPSSAKGSTPHNELIISIGDDVLAIEDEVIAQIADIDVRKDKTLEALDKYLAEFKARKQKTLTSFEKVEGLSITIIGDKGTPFDLLKQVMWTCRGQDFRNISLAVNRVSQSELVF